MATAGRGGTGAEGGRDTAGGMGGATPGGTTGQVSAGHGGAGSGGSSDAGRSGAAGSASDGFVTTIPHPTEREQEILAPLGTDDATIEGTSGTDLTALERRVHRAKAYVLCRCGLSPDMPPDDPDMVEGCAAAETDVSYLGRPGTSRCIDEGMASVPGFEDYVRCLIVSYRDYGIALQRNCTNPGEEVPLQQACERSEEIEALFNGCWFAYYCADDERVDGSRCDQIVQCSDQSDELGCFDLLGRDWFWCDGELLHPADVCRPGGCGLEKVPPVCEPAASDRYLCNDGVEVSVDTVCDRTFDCADGSDERYCVK
jgi:hypothetical protein